jgi:hypothetical protein
MKQRMNEMVNSYIVTCNLIEVKIHKDKVMEVARSGKCVGFGGTGDKVTFHFPTMGSAMMVFLELETFLDNVSVETSPVFINKNDLKGVFKYD